MYCKYFYFHGDWGLGIGDWGLGIGDWAQSQPPNQYGQQPPNQYGQRPPNQYGQQPPNQYGQQPSNQYGQQPPNQYGQQPPNQYGQQPPNQQRQQPPNQQGQQPPPNQYSQQPPNQTIPGFRLLSRGNGIDEREYYIITHSANDALLAKADPLSTEIVKRIKRDLGGEWFVFSNKEGASGYDFSLSIVQGNDFLSFIINNFRFQVCRLRD